ncbi:MAG: hypothetical protein HZB46_04700, partial [Solirubrobacterales bacterium]|nr:hypothetical protein [Solirubrobacterales bacterium]
MRGQHNRDARRWSTPARSRRPAAARARADAARADPQPGPAAADLARQPRHATRNRWTGARAVRHHARVMTAQAGVRVLEADRGLAAAIPDAERAEARARLTVPAARLPVGSWDPESTPGHAGGAFGYLILDGLVLRDVELAGRSCVELLGPGDVLTRGAAPPAVPADVTWRIADPSRVAVLDDRVIAAMRRWPDLAVALFARAGEQLERLALQQAIGQLPRADLRLIATLWHLADRWGRVCPDGVELRLALTHDLLGRLVGAAVRRQCAAGRVLFHGGDSSDAFYLVRHGHVAFVMSIPARGTTRLLTVGP